jgi:hypothetical protein
VAGVPPVTAKHPTAAAPFHLSFLLFHRTRRRCREETGAPLAPLLACACTRRCAHCRQAAQRRRPVTVVVLSFPRLGVVLLPRASTRCARESSGTDAARDGGVLCRQARGSNPVSSFPLCNFRIGVSWVLGFAFSISFSTEEI